MHVEVKYLKLYKRVNAHMDKQTCFHMCHEVTTGKQITILHIRKGEEGKFTHLTLDKLILPVPFPI